MNKNETKTKKEILMSQNKELKAQIEMIKLKIEDIKKREVAVKRNNIIEERNKFSNGGFNYNDTEMFEISKKIDYYIEEISKKKFQIDNLISIERVNALKNKLKSENEKIASLQYENYSLISVYNNQVKSINKSSLKFDLSTEEKLVDKIKEKKDEFKNLQEKYSKYDNKLKEQRKLHMDLNETIAKIKNKITILKKNKSERNEEENPNKINYEEMIKKIEMEIENEQEMIVKEESEYKETMLSNEKLINELTENIIKKRELLKDKGNV